MPEAKRNAVKQLHESFGLSLRRLCVLVGLNRSSWHYKPQPDKNGPIRLWLRELADERKRLGYRCLYYLLRREEVLINHKRTERLYREENLMASCQAMDFMSDNLHNGRRFRVLNVLDSYSRDFLS